MDRQRFKLVTMINALTAWLGFRQHVRPVASVETSDHDAFHHPRNRNTGKPNIRKYRRWRNARNEMAFQSRKHNR